MNSKDFNLAMAMHYLGRSAALDALADFMPQDSLPPWFDRIRKWYRDRVGHYMDMAQHYGLISGEAHEFKRRVGTVLNADKKRLEEWWDEPHD